MNLKELPFPIRIYWDITPVPAHDGLDYAGIARSIADMKFFVLNLLNSGPKLSNECLSALAELKNENIIVSLTVSHSALNSETFELLSDLRVNEVLLEASSKEDLRAVAETVKTYKNAKMAIGASIQVERENYQSIPDIVSFCLDHEISRLVFPMQRLTDKKSCFYIEREEGMALTQKLNDIEFGGINITIHDPFLWRIFYPGADFPGGGCQAGNSMAAISPDGTVHPCPSMPISLGNLTEHSLRSILASDSKKELVKSIRTPPEECLQCGELSGCMGGCSGRVFVLANTMNKRDPACGQM